MRKTFSIKAFLVFIFVLLFIGVSGIFYNYYLYSTDTITKLFISNFQKNVLNLQHTMDDNDDPSYGQVKADIDEKVSLSKSINDVHIFSDKQKLLYSTSRDIFSFTNEHCIPMSQLNDINIFSTECYSFKTLRYSGLKSIHDDVFLHMSQKYLNSLLRDQQIVMMQIFIITTLIVSLLIWYLTRKYISQPLSRLREFAYYHDKVPKNMSITELESIRYSLDITFKRLEREQKELYKLSTKDPLSGLYNRLSLTEKVEWLIANNKRTKTQFALLFFDLDNFKNINDTMGHNIGDKALQYTSKILLDSIRETDFASRIGGDEFVIVIPDLDAESKALEVINRIQHKMLQAFQTDKYKYYLTASIGIATFPKDGEDIHELLKNADIAMYKAKELGKNSYHFFTEELNTLVHEHSNMQNLLIEAYDNNYFELYYQPKTDITSKKVVACEALIRLIHPEHGLIPPDAFISIAEETSFIIKLGEWIIDTAVKQIKKWEETPYKDIIISINVSAKQFQDSNFLEKLDKKTQDIDRSKLDIELTESVFVDNFDQKNLLLGQIKDLGFTLSLDDFGTGYSSLSYLKEIPFDTLKIDKAFIDDLEKENGAEFVKMIIQIAHMFNLEVVAEGVETEEQRAFLQTLSCDLYQGYLCSKPVPVKQFEELI